MKKIIIMLSAALMLINPISRAGDYNSLWKKVENAENKDLPRTRIKILEEIAAMAVAEKEYGHLLKAEYLMMEAWTAISPDSLTPRLALMERKADVTAATDTAVAAVYYSVLGKTYSDNTYRDKEAEEKSVMFFKKSMEHPAVLAAQKALDYEPFVVKGHDSYIFNDDLLSLLGYAAADFKTMHDYYKGTGNRVATMMSALEMIRQNRPEGYGRDCFEMKKSAYAVSLDSLINIYSDLKECGEVAIERYHHMAQCRDMNNKNLIDYINKALANWGEWPHMNELRNELKKLTDPKFSVKTSSDVLRPAAGGTIYINVRNINKVDIRLSRLNIGGDTKLTPANDNDYKKLKKLIIRGSEKTFTRSFIGNPDYLEVRDSIETGALTKGVYLMEVMPGNNGMRTKRTLIYVSDMFAVYQELPEDKLRIAVLNASSGQPVAGAKLSVRTADDKIHDVTCNDKGETIFNLNKKSITMLRAYTEDDKAMPMSSAWSNFTYYEDTQALKSANLFTDRSMYRPGQTVRMSGFVHTCKGVEKKALANHTLTVYLKDANYKTIKEINLTSDEFGSFAADFQLPANGLTGTYSLRTDHTLNGYVSFNVEEYKRPTFAVEFPEINQKYSNGDTLVVTAHAKSYAGVPVRDARVRYKVTRSQSLWWRLASYNRGYSNNNTSELFSGEATTDDKGAFKIEMPMLLPSWEEDGSGMTESEFNRIARFYTVTAEVDVTDAGGETRQGVLSLPLGNRPTAFGIEMGEKIVRDSINTIKFSLKNMAGKPIDGNVVYRIDGSDAVFNAKTNTDATIDKAFFSSLKAGRHTLTAICESDTLKHEFILFGLDDTTPCINTPEWFYYSSNQFPADGSPVCLQVGSSETDVHILYTAISGNKVIESGTADISNGLFNRKLTYKDEYGDVLLLNFIWVKNGKSFTNSVAINRPLPDKKLTMKWSSFRDRLTPGQKEEWTLDVTNPDGSPADAQLMATLYDASLDQIKPHSWWFYEGFYLRQPYIRWGEAHHNSVMFEDVAASKRFDDSKLDFNHFDLKYIIRRLNIRGNRPFMHKAQALGSANIEEEKVVTADTDKVSNSRAEISTKEESAADSAAGELKESTVTSSIANGTSNNGEANVSIRENLNETAFFYPTLRTDSNGRISMKFTLPESITTWKFIGLAHDRNINSGTITAEAVASKTVMVQPNMPRFIRKGDKATISARIFNTSERAVKGSAVMQLVDPETDKTVYTQKKNFNIDAAATGSVTFEYGHTGDSRLLVCRIYANGKNFSDGEQHYLPILSDEELVTNTMPFTQNEKGVKSIDIKQLFAGNGRDERLTVEYTNNPAWLAIQTLPFIGAAAEDNSINLATAYYANSIAKHILAQSQGIKNVFEQWRNEETKGSLSSNLERNQELKNIILDETPWTLTADNDAERKLQIANYFNENTIDNNLNSIIEKLEKLQNADGSWCWWQGMKTGSQALTGNIATLLARLEKMTGHDNRTSSMLDKAVNYLGTKIVDEVKRLKKAEKEGRPAFFDSECALQYLYICSLNGHKMSGEEGKAADYMLNRLKENNGKSSLYTKALMTVVLAQRGEKSLAKEYLKSLEEYSVSTKDMGRYYDSPRAAYSWFDYRIPTQVSVIEAMTLAGSQEYAKAIDEMKLWLLQQKRVQAWDTPINNVNAVYAFLNGRASILENKENSVLAINGKQIETHAATAGLGYVKTEVKGIKSGTFTADKSSEGTSWGALYAQTVQKSSEINASSAGFTITKEILSADGKSQTTFSTGDKITVRITITAERDYDFVQIKDKRAACMEPASQLSGYRNGCYTATKDNATMYYFDRISKGKHVIETTYHIDRAGIYETGTCTIQNAYAPEYSARTASTTIEVK